MIADALRVQVEAHAQRTLSTSRLLFLARRGQLLPAVVARYLVAVRSLVALTPVALSNARARAETLGEDVLTKFFAEKYDEEFGHEQWALDDLQGFRETYGFTPEDRPVAAIQELQRYLLQTIEEDPRLYLSYILWAEYFIILVGGAFAEALVRECKVPVSVLSCLSKHIVLDVEHTEDDMNAIDELVVDPRVLPRMRAVLRRVEALFDRACVEMLEEPHANGRVSA